jgi:hypothetical protein
MLTRTICLRSTLTLNPHILNWLRCPNIGPCPGPSLLGSPHHYRNNITLNSTPHINLFCCLMLYSTNVPGPISTHNQQHRTTFGFSPQLFVEVKAMKTCALAEQYSAEVMAWRGCGRPSPSIDASDCSLGGVLTELPVQPLPGFDPGPLFFQRFRGSLLRVASRRRQCSRCGMR